MKKSPVINNIVDAFRILDLIKDSQELGISDIAKSLDLPKATTYRIVKSLEAVQAIKQEENSNYSLDYRLLTYSKGIVYHQDIRDIAQKHMEEAVKITGETINLGMEYKGNLLIIQKIDGEFYQLQTTLQPIGDLYCSGMGKLFLSQWEDEKLQDYYQGLEKRTVNTIVDFQEFKQHQKKIQKNQLSIDKEEYEYGMSCYSVPIFDKEENIRYALSISGPSSRLEYKGIDFLTQALKDCAQKIQKELHLQK